MSRIDEIRQRCEAADRGPWKAVVEGPYVVLDLPTGSVYHGVKDIPGNRETVVFIASTREDIPWLLERLAACKNLIQQIAAAGTTNYEGPHSTYMTIQVSSGLKTAAQVWLGKLEAT